MAKRSKKKAPRSRIRRNEHHRGVVISRLDEVRRLLDTNEGVSIYEIANALDVTDKTIKRYLDALRQAGDRLDFNIASNGKTRLWRTASTRRGTGYQLQIGHVVPLFMVRQHFDYLRGTGLKEYLDEMYDGLSRSLNHKRVRRFADNLDRKILDKSSHPVLFEDQRDTVDAIVDALIAEDRILIDHRGPGENRGRYLIDPYTLISYRSGLYVSGYSHKHEMVLTFAVDNMRDADWQRGDRFEYPADYDPAALFEASFGIMRRHSEPEEVRLRFDAAVSRQIRRRHWHPSSRIRNVKGGIELTMRVHLDLELRGWIMSWADTVEVLAPDKLRKDVAAAHRRAAQQYR